MQFNPLHIGLQNHRCGVGHNFVDDNVVRLGFVIHKVELLRYHRVPGQIVYARNGNLIALALHKVLAVTQRYPLKLSWISQRALWIPQTIVGRVICGIFGTALLHIFRPDQLQRIGSAHLQLIHNRRGFIHNNWPHINVVHQVVLAVGVGVTHYQPKMSG